MIYWSLLKRSTLFYLIGSFCRELQAVLSYSLLVVNHRWKQIQIGHECDCACCSWGNLIPCVYYAGVSKICSKFVQTSVCAVYTEEVIKLLLCNIFSVYRWGIRPPQLQLAKSRSCMGVVNPLEYIAYSGMLVWLSC